MALKRPVDNEYPCSTTTEIKVDKEREPGHIPPLKLRIKDIQRDTSPIHNLLSELSLNVHQQERLITLLRLSEIPICSLSSDDAEHIIRILKDILRKEENQLVKAKILSVLDEVMKKPSMNRMVSIDDLVDLAQKEGNFDCCCLTTVRKMLSCPLKSFQTQIDLRVNVYCYSKPCKSTVYQSYLSNSDPLQSGVFSRRSK